MNDKNLFKEAAYNYSDDCEKNAKELTPEILRDFVISFEKKFQDDVFTKDRLACFSILKKILEDEKDKMKNFVFNKLPQYFEDPNEANNYDEITDICDDEIKIYGCYRDSYDSCYDEEYDCWISIDFLLDPEGGKKRQDFFAMEKEKVVKENLKKEQEAIVKRDLVEKELFLKLKAKYEHE